MNKQGVGMKKTAFLLISILVLSVACKKTVDSEKKSWDSNLKKIESLSFEYPSFKTVLNEQVKLAEPVMKASESITKEEDKIKKMGEANAMLSGGFIGNLSSIKSMKADLKSKIIKARGLKLEMNERFSANRAISDADSAVMEGDNKLKSAVENKSQAETLTQLVLSDLKLAMSGIDQITAQVKQREDKEQQKTQAEQQKVQDEQLAKDKIEKEKQVLAQPVKCKYCSSMNPAGSVKCKSCGAGIK